MKNLFLIIPVIVMIVACGQSERSILEEELQERNGLFYAYDEGAPYTGKVIDKYENGQLKEEWTYEKGVLEGVHTEWYEDGRKKEEVTFVNGNRDGVLLEWYENGQKKLEKTFKMGVEDGLAISWHKNGHKKSEGTYVDGSYEGLWTKWYEDGQKEEEGTFKGGDGVTVVWDEIGKKIYELTWEDGQVAERKAVER
jgi:antitoxin component YwqK of YwqJK toxin-antitoxin module